MMNTWYTGTVRVGNKRGRTIGFPTINLDPQIISKTYKKGIYASLVRYKNKTYIGALYFGERLVLHETYPTLEIYLLNFDEDMYGKEVAFTIKDFIHAPQMFTSLEALKKQIKQDVADIKKKTLSWGSNGI